MKGRKFGVGRIGQVSGLRDERWITSSQADSTSSTMVNPWKRGSSVMTIS